MIRRPPRSTRTDTLFPYTTLFRSHGLRANGRVIGVAVVKVRLDALEERWQRAHLEAYVSDENGIIILSSNPTRRLKAVRRSEEHTSELQSLMRTSYAVFCLKTKNTQKSRMNNKCKTDTNIKN